MNKTEVQAYIEKDTTRAREWAQEAVFTEHEETATRYFYQRLRAIYGAAKYKAAFPSAIDLQISRREYAKQIGEHSREQIDFALDNAKRQMEHGEPDFMWPNIALILSGLTLKNYPAHKCLIAPEPMSPEDREKSKSIGIKTMAGLRAAFDE